MKKWLIRILVVVVAISVVAFGVFRYMNPPPMDLYSYYIEQDLTPEGKTAVFHIGLSTTEDYEPTWWYNIYQHVAHARMPWPIRNFALADVGITLVDPDRYYAREEFVPTRLVDRFGSEHDMDKVPYIEKYRQGMVEWVPPRESVHLDTGNFLYRGRTDGIPTSAGKRIGLARVWYYDKGIEQRKIPADYQSQRIYELAFGMLNEKYPGVDYRVSDSLDPYLWHNSIYELLDGGAETLVLASPMVMYSDYEDFHNGFQHSFEIVAEWEEKHGRDIKLIIAPPMGYMKAMRDGYLLILKDKLDQLPQGADVKMVWTVHGMPWLAIPNESWLKMSPPYLDAITKDTEVLFTNYDFGRTEIVIGQDHFADHYWDPDGVHLSTHTAYMDGVEDDYDFVLSIPLEFYNENTDTLFTHAMTNYESFPGYDVYNPIDYPDWDQPYTQDYQIENTRISYLGIPTGDRYRPYVARALFDSLDAVLSNQADSRLAASER